MAVVELEGLKIADRYTVHEQIGEGGMGSVYRAYDEQLQRDVALKVLRKEWVDRPEVLRRLDRECLHTAKIGAHSNIVSLYDRLEHEGSVILVIEYVPGETLDVIIQRTAEQQSAAATRKTVPFDAGAQAITLTQADIISIGSQCLVGLAHAHGCGLVHRDIKPSNILVYRNRSGALQAKILDFGIGKAMQEAEESVEMTALTRTDGPGPGSPPYMAPEQIAPSQFGDVSEQTDLYAMGVTLYEMLTLTLPFEGKSITEFLHAHTSLEPRDPRDLGVDLPPELVGILRRALRKKKEERYQTADEFRMDLEAARSATASSGTMMTPPAGYKPHAGTPAKKRSPLAALAAIAAVVVLVAAGTASYLVMASGNNGSEEGGAASDVEQAGVVPMPQPEPVRPPADDSAVGPEHPAPGTLAFTPEQAESAQRTADLAKSGARALFGDDRRPENNQNFSLGLEKYREAESLMTANEYRLAAESFALAAEFFEGAVPPPPTAVAIVEEETSTQAAPAAPATAQTPAAAPARTAPAREPEPPARPAQARQEPPAQQTPPAAEPTPPAQEPKPSNAWGVRGTYERQLDGPATPPQERPPQR